MNKILLSFGMFLLLCLVACGRKAAPESTPDTLQSDTDTINDVAMEEISPEQTVEFYYEDIIKRYMQDHQTNQNQFLDYCSAELKQLCKDAAKKERIYHEDGPFDFDMWINAKIFDNLSLKSVEFYSAEEGNTIVEVTLRNTGQENKIFVYLVNENGLWMVDDFSYPEKDKKTSNIKALLQEYVAEEQ